MRRATTEYIEELARLCRDLGGSVMVLGSPLQRNLLPGVTMDEAMELRRRSAGVGHADAAKSST